MKHTTFGAHHERVRRRPRTPFWVAWRLLALILTVSGAAGAAAPAASAPATWQKSVTLQSRSPDDFAGATSDAAIEQAYRANANHLTLIIPYQQADVYSSDIFPAPFRPTDAALIHAVNKAHSLGMRVTFKIHLDPNDGYWRAWIDPSDRDAWYRDYSSILNYYASLAQQNQVEQMYVGAELISMAATHFDADNTRRWRDMIAQVRQRFGGTLTYSANWGGSYDSEEFSKIGFWDALDFIGISGYFELANYDNPSVSQLMDSWDFWNTTKIQPFQRSIGKPVLFTELGYRSVDGAATQPWNWAKGGNYNPQEQVNAITAFLEYWSAYPWVAGLHYWSWHSDPNCCGPGDTAYEVQNKPGYDALRAGFLGSDDGGPIVFTFGGADVSPDSGPAGSNFTLNAAIKANTASSALIDMEVYDAAGSRVYQRWIDNQSFTAGQTRNFSFTWNAPAGQASGEYTLSVGVFANDNGWTTNYLWIGNAAGFTIRAGTPASTATPTRTATSTRTATPGATVTAMRTATGTATPTSTQKPAPQPSAATAPTMPPPRLTTTAPPTPVATGLPEATPTGSAPSAMDWKLYVPMVGAR